ncbi:MAG: leucyl/phenylalanyl-tRNA--protein transferase [Gammaproteobacteria bacterium]
MEPLLSLINNQLVDEFPDPITALDEPDGLLAAGGDLQTESLLDAYRRGIFPWYSEGQPILWWCPAERSVIYPGQVNISRSLGKTLRRNTFEVSFDTNFVRVVDSCAAPRSKQAGTWITPEMRDAYIRLHAAGYAHSIECYIEGELVGGLYGVSIGAVFFGESMFTRVSDASKVALVSLSDFLRQWGYELIDCQIHNPHLATMGAELINRTDFLRMIRALTIRSPLKSAWENSPTVN